MKLARMMLGSVLLPACVTLVACGSTQAGDEPGGAGKTGSGSGGHHTGSGGSGNMPGAGSGNAPSGGSGSVAGSGNNPGGGFGSIAGSGSNPSGGSGSGSFGGSGGHSGGAGGRANGGSGGKANGGSGGSGTGGSSTGTAGGPALDCNAAPPTGGTVHTSTTQSNKAAGLDWTIWSNGPKAGSITTYDVPAFSAAWDQSSDFLARMGLQWNATKTYDQIGTITAQFAAKKSGTGGQYSYIGIYGWSISPCVEWYIVDDSYNKMPVNPGNTTNMGTAMIDGGTYTLYKRSTNGTGGSKCGSQTTWDQYYSIRQTARDCGQISISAHFDAWAAAKMPLGKMDQAQVLVEVGGGTGSIDFSVANVTVTAP